MGKLAILAKSLTGGKFPLVVRKEGEEEDVRDQTTTIEARVRATDMDSAATDANGADSDGADVPIDLEPTDHGLQPRLLGPSISLTMTGETRKAPPQQKESQRRNSWGFPTRFLMRTRLEPNAQVKGGSLFKSTNRRPTIGSEKVHSTGSSTLTAQLNEIPISSGSVSPDAENDTEIGGRGGEVKAGVEPINGHVTQPSISARTGGEISVTSTDSISSVTLSSPVSLFANKIIGGRGNHDTSVSIESLHRHRSSGVSSGANQIKLNFDRLQSKLFGRDEAREHLWEAFLRVSQHSQGGQQNVDTTPSSFPGKAAGAYGTETPFIKSVNAPDMSAQGGQHNSVSATTTGGNSRQKHGVETVFIHGPSGVGKGRLVDNFQKRIRQQTYTWQQQQPSNSDPAVTGNGTSITSTSAAASHHQKPSQNVRRVFFLQSRYSQQLASSLPEPFSAFKDATEQLGGLLVDESAHDKTGYIRRMLVDGLAVHEIRSLVRLCPDLKRVLLSRGDRGDQNVAARNNFAPIDEGGENDDDSDNNDDDGRVRRSMTSDFSKAEMGLLFLRLMRVIGRPLHPIVLFLDDIQWADPDSLDLISTLVCEEDSRHFMLIVAFREEFPDRIRNECGLVGLTSSGVLRAPSDKLSVYSIIARKAVKVDATVPPSLSGSASMALSQAPKQSSARSRSNFMVFGQNSDRRLHVIRRRDMKHNVFMQQQNTNENEANENNIYAETAPPPTFLRKAITIGTYNPSKILHSFERKPADLSPRKLPKPKHSPEIAAPATKPSNKSTLSLLDDDSDDEENTLHMLGPIPSVPRPIPFAQKHRSGVENSPLPTTLSPMQMPPPPPPTVATGYEQMRDILYGRQGASSDPARCPPSDRGETQLPLLSRHASPLLPKIVSRDNSATQFAIASTRGSKTPKHTGTSWVDENPPPMRSANSNTSGRPELPSLSSWASRSARSSSRGMSSIGSSEKRLINRPPRISHQLSPGGMRNRLPSVSESSSNRASLSLQSSILGKFHGVSGRTIRHSQMSDLTAGFADISESSFIEPGETSDVESPQELLVARYTNVTDIPLRNLEVDVVCEIIAHLTSLEIHDCLSLGSVVTKKTHGNPTSVLRFLEILQQDGLLRYSMGNCRWEWDTDYINNSTTVTNDVGELLSARIKNLPPKSLAVLKLAACIGYSFHKQLLEQLAMEDFSLQYSLNTVGGIVEEIQIRYREDLHQILEESYSAGLLEMTDQESLYRFSHDLIHQNLYSKIEEDDKKRLHLRIARAMQDQNYFGRSSLNLFVLVNHFNSGLCEIGTDNERVQVVELNLQASVAARAECSFRSAAVFLEKAIASLKSKSDWSTHYSLVLEVYSSAAEVHFSCGDLQKSASYAEEVVRNARDTKDQIRGHFIKLEILGRERRYTQALEEGFRILDILGCKIPERMKRWHLSKDLAEIRRNLKGKTTEDFLAMTPMTDFVKTSCLRLMDTMTLFFVLKGDDSTANLLLTRMMLITLKNGISIYSPYSFAAYGMLLYQLGDTEGGHHYGTIGLRIAEQLRSKRALTRTAFIFYTYLNHLKKPLTDGIEPMLNAHRIGLQVGDVEYSSMCLATYSNLYIAVGLPLQPYMEDMKQFCEQLELYRQSQPIALMAPFRQLALNLMGRSENPLVLNGDAMNFEEFCFRFMSSGEVNEEDQAVTYCNLMYATLLLAYIFQDINRMQEWFRHYLPKSGVLTASHFDKLYITLFSGLAGFSLYRETGRRRYYRKANKALSDMKSFSTKCGINAIPMYRLLVAEKQEFAKDRDRTIKSYDESISTFARCGMIHLEAIACERAGDYMKSRADTYWSQSYYGRSQMRYMEWGAIAKAEQMNTDHRLQNFQFKSKENGGVGGNTCDETSVQSQNAYVSLRGKRRYDASTWQTIAKADVVDNPGRGSLMACIAERS